MKIIFQREFWLNLAGACVIAVVAAAPILMSGVMDRGFEIAKQSVAGPLAMLALGAVLLLGGWRTLLQQRISTRLAASCVGIFLLLAAVSTAISENPEIAIFGGYYRREGLLAWCIYGGFFFAVLGWARESGRISALLDVLLLASVVPAGYALQQRLGLDFYALGVRDFSRPGGTLGSPPFLAAYLGLLLPLAMVRCWQSRRALPELVLWLTVVILQLSGLLATQSRGPLLAGMLGLLMLACCAAACMRKRLFFKSAVAAFAAAAALIVAINTSPAARHWAQDIPVVSRLVFALERDASFTTRLASRSAASRLAIWAAGVDTFVAAPRVNKVFGFGPELAYLHYFSHMPASVMRIAGYGVNATYDRMHADTLDISLNFGLLAWLIYCAFFATVMYVAARALWTLSGAAPRWLYAGAMLGGGVLCSGAAIGTGFASAAVPAFGVGMCGGCFLFTMGCAWRALVRGMPTMSTEQAGRWILLAGLNASLWVFWLDAQVNIPVLTTRLISFAVAALILIVADACAPDAENIAVSQPDFGSPFLRCGVVCALVAVISICLPVEAIAALHGARRAMPILVLLFITGFAVWTYARRRGSATGRVAKSWLVVAAGVPLLYALIQIALIANVATVPTLIDVRSISIASVVAPISIFGVCIAYAWRASCDAALIPGAAKISRVAQWSSGLVAVAILLVAAQCWRATQADIASSLAIGGTAQQRSGRPMIELAVRLMPYERYYRRQLVFELLGSAVADLRLPGTTPEGVSSVMRNLGAAESAARVAALLFPGDPWVLVALANVLQVEALRVLRPRDPAGGSRAAREAHELFARAHRMFPSEPLMLRNWAELYADEGNLPQAYRLLDRMESLIPNDPEPYFARIAIAIQAADKLTVLDTLRRARPALEPGIFSQLSVVANQQQN